MLPGPAHAFHALCTAEGEPPPVLDWSGPALGNGSAAAQGPGQGQGHGHQVTAELPALAHDGRYTCTASNSLGRAEASVYLFRFHGASGASALALPLGALGLKALLLLGVLAARAAARRRLGGCTLGPGWGGAGALLGKAVSLPTCQNPARTLSAPVRHLTFLSLRTAQDVGTSKELPFTLRKLTPERLRNLPMASGRDRDPKSRALPFRRHPINDSTVRLPK